MALVFTARGYVYISGEWVELNDIQPVRGGWGMSDNKPTTRIGDPGEMTFSLNNSDGQYIPGGPSALSGWKKGLPFKWVINYRTLEVTRFRGTVEDIKLPSRAGDKKVYITVLDWFEYASKYPVVNPELLENATIDDGITELLTSIPIQPQETTLTAGDFTFPTLFDTVKGNTKAYAEFAKFALSEPSYIYLRHDGDYGENLVSEARSTRNGTNTLTVIPLGDDEAGALLLEDGDYLLLEDGGHLLFDDIGTPAFTSANKRLVYKDIKYGENIINRFTSNAYPKKTDELPVRIYRSERPLYLASGDTKTFRTLWRDPEGKRPINAVTAGLGKSTVAALCHFDSENVNTTGAGATGSWFDETGKIATHTDVPWIDFSKFGDGSAYFDGSNAWIDYPDSPDWDFGSGDFWVEWWEYRYATTVNQTVVTRNGGVAVPPFSFGKSTGTNNAVYLSSNGSTNDIANGVSMGSISINTWTHFAAGRASGTLYTFKNGTLVTSVAASGTILAATTALTLGRYNTSTYYAGNIDDFFVLKGECLHTSSFTAPTEPRYLSGTFYNLNTLEDGSGTDLSDLVTASGDYGTEGATHTVTNGSANGGYLTVSTYGQGIYSDSPLEASAEDSASISENGYQNTTLQQAYQQDIDIGQLEANMVVDLEKNPRTVLNEVGMVANASDQNMLAFLRVDVGDLVHITITEDGVDDYFHVQGINFRTQSGVLFFNWIVKQAWVIDNGLELVAVEFGAAAGDAINFGYLPIVSADEVTNRGWSAWFYLDAVSASRDQVIVGAHSDEGGTFVYIDSHASDRILAIYASRYLAPGKWTATNDFTVGAWVHILVAYDHSDTSNNPTMYVNGSSVTVTEVNTPASTPQSEEGNSLIIGNWKTATQDYTENFDGTIKDVRVYNMDKTTTTAADLAAALYAEGAGGTSNFEGMVFQACAVRSEDEAGFEDLTLTDEKLLDAFSGYVGTPNGSPVVRLL